MNHGDAVVEINHLSPSFMGFSCVSASHRGRHSTIAVGKQLGLLILLLDLFKMQDFPQILQDINVLYNVDVFVEC